MGCAVMSRKVGWALDQLIREWGSPGDRMTSKRLAEAMGKIGHPKGTATISRWRRSRFMPPLDANDIAALCQALDCEVEDLLELRD